MLLDHKIVILHNNIERNLLTKIIILTVFFSLSVFNTKLNSRIILKFMFNGRMKDSYRVSHSVTI